MSAQNTHSARVQFLINTSVQDLVSSLPHYDALKPADREVIRSGLRICIHRNEKTKAQHLQRKLNQMEKIANKNNMTICNPAYSQVIQQEEG